MRPLGKAVLVFTVIFLAAGPSPAATSRWTPLGPFGGWVGSVTVDPTNARVLYVTLGIQGAFKSTDGGASWASIYAGVTYGSVAIDPSQPSTLCLVSSQVLQSTDGGLHWTAVASLGYGEVRTVAFDPVVRNRIYAGTERDGVLRSIDHGVSWSPARVPLPAGQARYVDTVVAARPQGRVFALTDGGLFRSTDGGRSWSPAGDGLPAGAAHYALAVDPADPRTVYAGLPDGLFRSSDGGSSWARTPVQPGGGGAVLSLAVSTQGVWAGVEPSGLFRSRDGGATWSAAGPSPSRRVTAVAISPSSPRTLYLGTSPAGRFLGGVFASTDGGATWARNNRGLTGLDVHSLEATPGRLWISVSGLGLFDSRDGGQSWTRAVPQPASAGHYFDLASSPSDARWLYACAWPQIWQTRNGGRSWSEAALGPPDALRPWGLNNLWVDPVYPGRLWATRVDLLLESRDAGASWTPARLPARSYGSFGGLAFAPSSPSTLYAGGSITGFFSSEPVVLKSTDDGASWKIVGRPPADYVGPMAVDPVDPELVYAVAGVGLGPPSWLFVEELWKSTDGSATWSEIGELGYSQISALAAPRAGTVWVAWDAGHQPRIFRSRDAGESWQDVTQSLWAWSLYEFVADPASPQRIYAATSSGVWMLTETD